ncbi:uncharacterized protein [Magallana gigas]|uniref:uncharacterized protein n=1 Tax=Magallana gigas TaxID=29159 RepID=UPI00334215B5
MDNATQRTQSVLQDGYDLPVYGLDTGWFLYIHVPALCCIFVSLFCASAVLIASFRSQSRSFFSWMRSERFVVYLSMCDALFNLTHSMDHLQMVITKDHVYPVELCEFYSFFLEVFSSAQFLMTNVAAFNAFGLIFLKKQFELGKYDWKLLLFTFGVPFVLSICALNLGYYGPTGSYCYFDAVKGAVANIFFTTVPMTTVLVANVVLYVLTWWKIHTESKRIKTMLGNEAQTVRASHKAAKLMSLFVAAFFVQWWALGIAIVWYKFAVVPKEFHTITVIFANIGGVVNGFVYIIIQRRKAHHGNKSSKNSGYSLKDSENSQRNVNVSVIDTKV